MRTGNYIFCFLSVPFKIMNPFWGVGDFHLYAISQRAQPLHQH